MIGQEEFKLVQYADDLTLFVPNIECVKLILQLLDRFTSCSGLKNHTKTEAMWIGSCRQNIATPLGLRWSKSVKAVGIVFTYNDTDQLQKNFYDKLKDIRIQIRLWNSRGLSLFGKVTVIKSLLLPKMLYVFSVLTTPGEFIKQLNTIIYKTNSFNYYILLGKRYIFLQRLEFKAPNLFQFLDLVKNKILVLRSIFQSKGQIGKLYSVWKPLLSLI